MPAGVTIETIYSADVVNALLTRASTTNELVEGGHVHMEVGISEKLAIPRIRIGEVLQKVVEQPTDEDAEGTFSADERYLKPEEFMAFTTFNPKVFAKWWRQYQPKGNLVFLELPVNVQNAMLAELAKTVKFELGDHFVNGVLGDGKKELFNGLIYRVLNDPDKVEIENPVAITKANIFDKLKLIRAHVPKALRNNPDLKIFMSIEDFDKYDEALTDLVTKGVDVSEISKKVYKGIKIVTLSSWPENLMICTVANMDVESNWWVGVGLSSDQDAILIDKLTNAGEKYFFKMKMKADTCVAWGDYCVVYDGRTA